MNLFGADNSWNNQATQLLGNVSFSNQNAGTSAVLFIFTERDIPNQFRRHHNYSFNGEFLMSLNDNIEMAQRKSTNNLSAMMPGDVSARSAILPNITGQEMNLRTFSDNATFVLVLDNDNQLSPLGTSTSLPSRTMMSGWIMGEPVTKKNMSAGYVYNPSAVFSTTHHTSLVVQKNYLSSGPVSQIHTTGDFDYVTNAICNVQMDGQSLFSLQPASVANSIITDPMNPHGFQIAGKTVENATSAIEIPSEINSPTYHLRQIVGGLTDSVKHLASPEITGGNDYFGGSDVLNNVFASMANTGSNIITGALRPDVPFTFADLERIFGHNLKVTVCNQPRTAQYDITTAAAPTQRNVFTSLLSTSIPPMLAQFGLAEVAFRYSSFLRPEGSSMFSNTEMGVFKLLNLAPMYQSSQNELSSAWDNFGNYLKMTVFPIITTNAGHFDVTVHCSLAGVSLIDLQFNDSVRDYGLIENNNLLGGLNTPLVGTQDALIHNASQLHNVMSSVSSVGTPADGSMGMTNLFESF